MYDIPACACSREFFIDAFLTFPASQIVCSVFLVFSIVNENEDTKLVTQPYPEARKSPAVQLPVCYEVSELLSGGEYDGGCCKTRLTVLMEPLPC
jgi:hypothetical protein